MKRVATHDVFISKVGDVFSRLMLTGITGNKTYRGRKEITAEAECICGSKEIYLYKEIMSGDVISCGCLVYERRCSNIPKDNYDSHPLKGVWKSMKARCYNKNNNAYKNYGGRGIAVCENWKNDSKDFFYWCLSNGWQKGLDLDRRDNSMGYNEKNCRFVTPKVNSSNKRNNLLLTAWGETKTMTDWIYDERCVVGRACLRNRHYRLKWDNVEDMLSMPHEERADVSRNNKRTNNFTAFGETKCITDWAKDERCVVTQDALRNRMKRGMSFEDAMTREVPKSARYKNGIGLMGKT